MLQEITAAELASVLGTEEEPVLVDVREPDEVADWSIVGVRNIPLGQLPGRLEELPASQRIVAVCASGNRSSQATQFLAARGFDVANLAGGMAAWGQVYDTAVVETAAATVVQVRRRGKGCLSYLVGAGDTAFVIDPSADVEVYPQVAEQFGWTITRVFDTHLHADHLSGARLLAEQTGASLHLNPADDFRFDFAALADGQRFVLPGGAELSVAVVHTPGHTEGSTMYFVGEDVVLSGDTIFVDGVGRPDLAERAEDFARNLHRSLRERVLTLPDRVAVLPAHYSADLPVRPQVPVAAPLGRLRVSLEPLSFDEDSFVAWATANVRERPPNYQAIVRVNMGDGRTPVGLARHLEAGPNRCSV